METEADHNPFEGWVTLAEAARLIGRDTSLLLLWVRRGAVRSYRIGRRTQVVYMPEVQKHADAHPARAEKIGQNELLDKTAAIR